MLLRASTHRLDTPSGESEIAAGPDTPGRERWLWELRLLATADADARASISLMRADGSAAALVLRGDPDLVEFSLRQEPVGGGVEIARAPGELTILVAVGGSVVIAGTHRLGELDALVVEGDEPGSVSAASAPGVNGPDPAGAAPRAVLAVARLVSTTQEQLRWVP